MRLTQGGFFKGNFIGESPRSGISFPDYVKLATAYGLSASRIEAADFGPKIDEFLAVPGPALCEVILDPVQGFEPRLSSRQLPDGRILSLIHISTVWPLTRSNCSPSKYNPVHRGKNTTSRSIFTGVNRVERVPEPPFRRS